MPPLPPLHLHQAVLHPCACCPAHHRCHHHTTAHTAHLSASPLPAAHLCWTNRLQVDICDFLKTAQANREMTAVIAKLQAAVERARLEAKAEAEEGEEGEHGSVPAWQPGCTASRRRPCFCCSRGPVCLREHACLCP